MVKINIVRSGGIKMYYAICKDLETKKWIILEFNNEKEQKIFIAGRGFASRFFNRHIVSEKLAIGVLAKENRYTIKYNGYNLNVLGLTL